MKNVACILAGYLTVQTPDHQDYFGDPLFFLNNNNLT
jgi:hypothetical protein